MNARMRQAGIANLWVVVTILVLIGFVGLAIDTGYLVWVGQQLQVGADGSALGGAQWVRDDVAIVRQAAQNVGLSNQAGGGPIQLDLNASNAPDGDIVIGFYDRSTRTFTPTETDANAVRVVARRTDSSLGGPVALLFGSAFGVSNASMQRDAIAIYQGGVGAGVIALNTDVACAFDVRGTAGEFVVEGGAIYVDSDNATAACHAGQPNIDADGLYVAGGTDPRFDDQTNYEGPIYEDSEPIGDPLEDLPPPTWDPGADQGAVVVDGGVTVDITPGYYSGGVTVRNGRLNVAPGIYILGGAGLDVNGGDLIAQGVMFYVDEGPVDIRGNGIIDISHPDTDLYAYPPSPDPQPYSDAAVAIFQARYNSTDSRILGTANFSIDGNIYMSGNHLEVGGTSDNFANGIIADTIEVHGDGIMQIDYEGQFGEIPGPVYLVE